MAAWKAIMHKSYLIYVLYDSISNSVFEGQVLHPLLDKQKKNTDLVIWLVTFERNTLQAQKLIKKYSAIPRIHVVVLKKLPFLSTLSLHFAVWQLKKFIRRYQLHSCDLIARGPLAGWICLKILSNTQYRSCTVQARGLLAQEYVYATQGSRNWLARLWHRLRVYQYHRIEHAVYAEQSHDQSYTIEAVSPALKQYVIETFGA